MTTKLEHIQRVVDSSGFPLQMGVAANVKRTEPKHRCTVLYTEHAWHDPASKEGGFIDLVIEGVESKCVFVVECQRVLAASWIFLNTKSVKAMHHHAKLWVNKAGAYPGSPGDFGWHDVPLEPSTPESSFCVVDGNDERSRTTFDRIATELVAATECFAHEDAVRMSAKSGGRHCYISVLVTTAKIALAQFSAAAVSLKDGKVEVTNAHDLPFIRFRKQLSAARSAAERDAYRADPDKIDAIKERTVFVVHVEALADFLTAFELDTAWTPRQ
jgi:hypothetical protein